ncbi:MAG: hypothetical protein RL329_2394 [Bacteroidota bacterium]
MTRKKNEYLNLKKMKKFLFILSIISVGFASCTDDSKDPILQSQVKNGALLAIRGEAWDSLNKIGFADLFSVSAATMDVFKFDADFISDNVNNLAKVTVYAKFKTGARVKIAEVDGSKFVIPTGGKYPRGNVSIPLQTILTAINKTRADFNPANFDSIKIESDLDLKDGGKVPASSVENSSLFESAHFYPAHNLSYLAGQ